MSLRPSELSLIVAELNTRLAGARIQNVWVPEREQVWLELRRVRETVFLVLSGEPQRAGLFIVHARGLSAGRNAPSQQTFRSALKGARLVSARCVSAREVVFSLETARGSRFLLMRVDSGGRPKILKNAPSESVEAVDETTSRLAPQSDTAFPWAEAAARFLESQGSSERTEALRAANTAPLRKRLAQLARTRVKVEAEASRGEQAALHQRYGALLAQNAHLVQRGMKEVLLIEYSSSGTTSVSVPLDPTLSPRAQAERHFRLHQRLSRGRAFAQQRLLAIDAQRAELEAQLSRLAEQASSADSPHNAAPSVSRRAAAPKSNARTPYREFVGSGDKRIWVGKDGRGNDTLTFRVAKPHHLWLHVRNAAGSHVVASLERGEVPTPELLLDAAHLAVHFSSQKGEALVDVAYVPVRQVRKVKGGSPGQVTFSQEKAVRVRHEPQRLERLLATKAG
ncbi:MAG: NFACT RNA binding domain-containing protein [Myxococcaceae bacterium]